MQEIAPHLPPEDLSALIGAAYDSALQRPQWQSFLTAFHRQFPQVAIAIAGFDGDVGKPVFTDAGFDPAYIEAYRDSVEMLNDSVSIMAAFEVGAVFEDSVVPVEVYQNLRLVRDWLKPQGFGPATAAVLARQDGRFVALNLAYPETGAEALRPLVDGTLRMIVPHLVRAIEISRVVSASGIVAHSLKGLLDNIKLPMFVTDKRAQFQFANPAGTALIERGSVLRRSPAGQITAATGEATQELWARIAQTAQDQATRGLQMGGAADGLVLCMVPLTQGGGFQSDFDTMLYGPDCRVGILIGQRKTDRPNLELLADVYGLSREESRACGFLMAGEKPEAIAAKLGKSPRTVRNQIQAVYAKLDVQSQVELNDAVGVFRVFGSSFEGARLPI